MKINENLLIDTNILIYSIDSTSKYFSFSNSILEEYLNIFITTKNISEFVCVLSKKTYFNVISIELEKLYSNFIVLFPNKISLEIFKKLIDKYHPIGTQVYDIEIVSLMLANNIKKVATINIKDFDYIEEIEVFNQNSMSK